MVADMTPVKRIYLIACTSVLALPALSWAAEPFATIGGLESHDPRFDKLVPPGTKIEVIGEGFSWIEGPLWLPSEDCLVFSNIPPNKPPRGFKVPDVWGETD